MLGQNRGASLFDIDNTDIAAGNSTSAQGAHNRLHILNLLGCAPNNNGITVGVGLDIWRASFHIAQHALECVDNLGRIHVT